MDISLLVSPFAFVLIALVSYRITRLIVDDSLIGTGANSGTKLSAKLDNWGYYQEDDKEVIDGDKKDGEGRSFWREHIVDGLTCNYCWSYWTSNIALALWTWSTPFSVVNPLVWILTGFAVAGAVAVIYEFIHKDFTINMLNQ